MICRATIEDMEDIAEVSSDLEWESWNKNQLLGSLLDKNTRTLIFKKSQKVLGFCIYTLAADEVELVLIGTQKDSRRGGVAGQLFCKMVSEVKNEGAKKLYLEVRSQNRPAIALYEKMGARPLGNRKGFYQNPKDDAIVYGMEIDNA